jgi:hypothetical protein
MFRVSRTILIAMLALGACTAETPSGRGLVAAAAKGKTFADFRADDADCRRSVAEPTAASIATAATVTDGSSRRYDASYTECIRAKGYRIVQGLNDYPLITTGVLPTAGTSGGGNR